MDLEEMESTWYLAPGQTLANTRIEDRGHALNVTKKGWSNITKHLDRNRLQQEAIEREQAHRAALKKGSEDMTKDWDNSVLNMRKRKEEERHARLQKEHDDKMENFFKLRDQQQAIRDEYIKNARKTIYISKGHPKSLTGALILSEVLYERDKQIELEKKIQEHEREEMEKYAKKVKEGAEQEKQENLEKEKKRHQKGLALKEIYLKDIRDREENNKKSKEDSIKREKQDIVNQNKETQKIKEILEEEDRKRRVKVKQEFQEFWDQQKRNKELLDIEDKEQNTVIDIYSKAKHGIECLRNKKVQEMLRAQQQRRDAASKLAVAQAAAKAGNEERLIKKAQEELEELENAKLLAKAAYKEQLIKDRNEDRANFLKREEIRQYEEAEMQKWGMLNRFKINDYTQQYEMDKKNKQWQATLKYRQELLQQIEENEKERQRIREEEDQLYRHGLEKLADEDKQFFDYASEVYNLAKNKNRNTAPIKRVMEEYKKENNLPRNVNKPCENYEANDKKNDNKTS